MCIYPAAAVPTCGGTYIGGGNGVRNQGVIEQRDDILVYTGEVFKRDLEVTARTRQVSATADTAWSRLTSRTGMRRYDSN